MARARVVALAAGVSLGLIGIVPAAADDPPAPTTPATTASATTAAPNTTVPPVTVTAPPGSTVAPPTVPNTAAPGTTRPGESTSTSSTTSTTVPDGDIHDFASTPAPLIPSAQSDPLFHAALTVDADFRDVAIGKVKALKAAAAAQVATRRSDTALKNYRQVNATDQRARKRYEHLRVELQAAAMHAYTGFNAQQTAIAVPEVTKVETVLPYKTYVEVTITEATQRVVGAEAVRRSTKKSADNARTDRNRASAEKRDAIADQRRTAADLKQAEAKLKADRKTLDDLIASMPQLAGTTRKLPTVTKVPAGAQVVVSPAGDIIVPATADPRTAVALQFIVAQLAKPYVWGGTGPNSYDCSGLMLRAYQAAGVTSMPRVSQGQQVWATPVDPKDVQPGDLVFFGRPAYHVGVYIGDGLMINAPFTGSYVRVDDVWASVTSYGRPIWSTPAT